MELFLGILIGAMVGSAAASLMRVSTQGGVYFNVVLGAVGAVIGGVFLGGGLPAGDMYPGLGAWSVWAMAGAIAAVTLANVVGLCLDPDAG